MTFWTIAHLVYDEQLLENIRMEVMPAFKDGKLDEAYLAQHCPTLESLINEMLRLTVASALVREVIAPTIVGDKHLRPGSKLLVS